MDKTRKQIQSIDAKMIALIAQRISLSEKLGGLKKRKKIPVRDKKREEELFQQWREIAVIHNAPPALINKLWKLILNESIKVQNKFRTRN